jgi:hypothetical protein
LSPSLWLGLGIPEAAIATNTHLGEGDDDYVAKNLNDDFNQHGIVHSHTNYNNDEALQDEEPLEDISYYRVESKAKLKKSIIDGKQYLDYL